MLSRWLLLFLLVYSSASLAADVPIVPAPNGDTTIVNLKVFADSEGRDRLSAGGWDIAGHSLQDGWVEVITSPTGAEILRQHGFRLELLRSAAGPAPLYPYGNDVSLPDQRYSNPQEIEDFLNQVVIDDPLITHLVSLGTTIEGRTIWGLKISDNAAQDEDELSILFNAAHHAREVMSPEVVMDTIDYLTDNYGSDPDVDHYVNSYEIWCVPMVNPDGVNIVHESDADWRKNARDNDNNGTIDIFDGVDLNRNYEWGWGYQCRGSSGSTFSGTYRGTREASENESQAMIALGRKFRPVFDVEYHAYGEDVFYSSSCDPQFSPVLTTISGGSDQAIGRVIAEDYASRIVQADGGVGYAASPYGSRVDGTGRDHQHFENGSISFVTEINNSAEGGFRPDFGIYRDDTVAGQRAGWLWLLDRIDGPAVGGRVTDAVTGLPVQADVALDELLLPDARRLMTRPDTGRFHLIVVPADYNLTVSAPGYETATRFITVGTDWIPTDIALQPTGASPVWRDDLEDPGTPTNWQAGVGGDTATGGLWEWGEPDGSHVGDVQGSNLQFGNARVDASPSLGRNAFVTGNAAGSDIQADDLEGGFTTLLSPIFDLSGRYAAALSWQTWFRNDVTDPGDTLTVEISNDAGSSWNPLATFDTTTETSVASPAWVETRVDLDTILPLNNAMQLRLVARDTGLLNVVEAAVDDFSIRAFEIAVDGNVGDLQVDGGSAGNLSWQATPGATAGSYDVVRGNLAELSAGAGSVHLGALTCIEENSPDLASSDATIPPVGGGFFYLVRFELGFSVGPWGFGSGGDERTGSGGCSP
jgi:hypothetical protein